MFFFLVAKSRVALLMYFRIHHRREDMLFKKQKRYSKKDILQIHHIRPVLYSQKNFILRPFILYWKKYFIFAIRIY